MKVEDRPDNSKLTYCPARATAWQSYADHIEKRIEVLEEEVISCEHDANTEIGGLMHKNEDLEKLVKELKRYAKHKSGCQAPFMPYKKPNPCTCGLDNLLKQLNYD